METQKYTGVYMHNLLSVPDAALTACHILIPLILWWFPLEN